MCTPLPEEEPAGRGGGGVGVATQKIDDDDGFELAAPSVTARRSGERRQSAESKRSRRIKPVIALILSR
jgi:hypothetical protein